PQASQPPWAPPAGRTGGRPPGTPTAPQPPGGPPSWAPPPGPPAWPPGRPVYIQQTTNGKAVAALVLGILWIYWIGSILALVFGLLARKEIAASGGAQGGQGMATAGIVLGCVGMGTLTLFALFAFLAAVARY
ncbi:MAG TPA: DUF4190 domain-containing protein, partial [Egibacteraceae bacterium]|nr:DUF4190 domain-containing protein [Egibacteraceae bacterium]